MWLVYDTDAFICKKNGKVKWYDTIVSEPIRSNVSTMKRHHRVHNVNNFDFWLQNLCLAAGIIYDKNAINIQQMLDLEKRCFENVSLSHDINFTSSEHLKRTITGTQLVAIPTNHPIVDYISDNYTNCFQDEFLMSMWDMQYNNQDIISFSDAVQLKDYPDTYSYVNTESIEDEDGYIFHVYPYDFLDRIPSIDEYWDRFFTDLSSKFLQSEIREPKTND